MEIDFSQLVNGLKEKNIPDELIRHLDLWFLQNNMHVLEQHTAKLNCKFNGRASCLLNDIDELIVKGQDIQERKESLDEWKKVSK